MEFLGWQPHPVELYSLVLQDRLTCKLATYQGSWGFMRDNDGARSQRGHNEGTLKNAP
ncbi:hypothetical protein M407DRAFT_241381 [Tulasnella calospora MUT 4182]|uniref:Uncharacterized protein n=1 Tax=Tulasnella calospora MUT 4182 TaxID=1051891 RepID=A0A0C3QTH3_9AGAM|nr:hypothetical protein M407DRAFT_241381 [Tulasnella calospora MUT 4182]